MHVCDTVVNEHFFCVCVDCPVVWNVWNFIEGIALREHSVNVKLHLTSILFVQWSNVKENTIKKMNHIILIANRYI